MIRVRASLGARDPPCKPPCKIIGVGSQSKFCLFGSPRQDPH